MSRLVIAPILFVAGLGAVQPAALSAATLATDKVVASDGTGTRITASFSTAVAGEWLIAFIASDGPVSGGQTLTVTGAGLSWTLVQRVNAQAGTSEIWKANAPSVLSNVTVTATQTAGGYYQSLTVVTFSGAAGTGTATGSSGLTGAPSTLLTTTKSNSLVYGVGNDWDRAVARTVGANQAIVHQALAPGGDTLWVQNRIDPIPVAGTQVQLNDTAPTTDRRNLAAVEIVPAAA